MPQERTFSASAAPHDYEDVAVLDGEIDIAHQHKASVCHREVFHNDVRCGAWWLDDFSSRGHCSVRD
jgi:hypothetical protein